MDPHSMLQPNPWSCYPTALACCTGLDFDEIIRTIGHDGSEIIQPERGEPWGRAAFIWEEIAIAALRLGWAVTRVYADVANADGSRRAGELHGVCHILNAIRGRAIAEVQKGENQWHCLVYDGGPGTLYDPATGQRWTIDDYVDYPAWPIHLVDIPTRIADDQSAPITGSVYTRNLPRVA
jgi:hypothetical protein